MADKQVNKKARKRKDAKDNEPQEKDEATKVEYTIAKWMRKNIPIKKTKFLNHTVEYFTANKAIDKLMDSPWTQPKKEGEEALFTTRESVVHVLDNMLRHKFFHRARKIAVAESELKSKKKKDKEPKEDTNDGKEKETPAASEKDTDKSKKEETATAAESSQAEGDKADTKVEDKRKKKQESEKKRRKIRLDMHLEQRIVDASDAYVWIYEPTPYYNYIFGFLVVVAVIAVCLFPLWPSTVRQGVYYLSLVAAGFLVFILALTVIRMIVFGVVWGLTFGKHHFWLLPNLTEDVGFTASFWPLYKYEYKPGESSIKESEEDNSNEVSKGNNSKDDSTNQQTTTPATAPDHSETESEGSQPSQTGKDFEMVEKEEIEQ